MTWWKMWDCRRLNAHSSKWDLPVSQYDAELTQSGPRTEMFRIGDRTGVLYGTACQDLRQGCSAKRYRMHLACLGRAPAG